LTTQTIADFLDLQLHDIAGTYPLQSIPQDLIDRQAEILLVQLANDRPPASILKFTFVDIEVYRPGDTQPPNQKFTAEGSSGCRPLSTGSRSSGCFMWTDIVTRPLSAAISI
jgi:hypothetical protein